MNWVVTPNLDPAVPPGAGSKAALVVAARLILTNCGVEMSPRRLHRIVQTYKEAGIERRGFGFLDYFANVLMLDAETRHRLQADPAIARAISYADPTGEQAVANVMNHPSRKD